MEAAKPINLVSSTAFERLAKDLRRAQGTIQPGKSSFLSACPALPLALFSLSSLLNCLCGLSPILSDSEKVLASKSPPPFFFFPLFWHPFSKGCFQGIAGLSARRVPATPLCWLPQHCASQGSAGAAGFCLGVKRGLISQREGKGDCSIPCTEAFRLHRPRDLPG